MASGRPLGVLQRRFRNLDTTDAIAAEVLERLMDEAPEDIQQQMQDNLRWIREAKANQLVVGSQARILYADAHGRAEIASAFNDAIEMAA